MLIQNKKRQAILLVLGALAAACLSTSAFGQKFSAPSCGNSLADSTCYTAPTPNNCSLPDAAISQRGACPVGYVGMMDQRGARNACTGVVTLAAGSDDSSCTNCGAPLSQDEALNIQRAIFEVSEATNQAYVNQVCSGFSCLDGAMVNDVAGGQPIGRIFRDHVWVSQDGFSSGRLPTTNRIKYLSESGKIPSNSPAFAFLPKDQSGSRPGSTNLGQVYSSAVKSAQDKGLTTCSGDGKNGCSINCSQPAAGWQGQFCATKTVQHWTCSDSYAVNSGGSWQPTKDATVPYTAKGNYANKDWKWPDIFAWNSPSMGNAGGAVYMCNSIVNTCNGWVTKTATYKCRVPATYDCSYSGADADGRPMSWSGSCQTCSVEMGAKWDFELAQANDCPATPMSTRSSDNRIVWQADLAATSCPINGSGTNNNANPRQCPAGQVLDATGSSCSCKPGFSWNGSSCLPPPVPGTPPAFTLSPLSLSNGIAYSGVPMGALANGAQISSLSLTTPVATFPSGMFPHFSGNLALISGTPNANGSYSFGVKADYAAGVDAAGNKYPAGVVTNTASVTVTGCPAANLSWAGGGNTCYGSVGNSASIGTSATIASTSAAPAGATGSNVLSCNVLGGNWASSSSSCLAPAPVGGINLAAFPSFVYEIGSSGAAQLWLSPNGAWRIVRQNCGNESIPGWTAWGAWEFCKSSNVSGNFLTPGSNPADFEIRFSNGVFTQHRQDRRNRATTTAYPFGDCEFWRDMTTPGSGCSFLGADGANAKGIEGDVSLYYDESIKFTISIRRKSNPTDSMSINATFAESFQSGFVTP